MMSYWLNGLGTNWTDSCKAHVQYVQYRRSGNFRVKNNSCEKFRVIKFSRFHLFREIFLTVDDRNMNERLESSWRLVYYQVSGEPGITGCSRRSDIYLGKCGFVHASLFSDHRGVILFFTC